MSPIARRAVSRDALLVGAAAVRTAADTTCFVAPVVSVIGMAVLVGIGPAVTGFAGSTW